MTFDLEKNFFPEDKLVSLEQAKLLREKGFKEPTYYYWQDRDYPYSKRGLKRVKLKYKKMNHNKYNDFYSAPTIEEANKWLEKKFKENFKLKNSL